MTEDERERLERILEGGAGYSAGKPAPLALAAAQLRADGERIKALEEAQQWLPIETAPKEGEYLVAVLLGGTNWEQFIAFPPHNIQCAQYWRPLPNPPSGEGE